MKLIVSLSSLALVSLSSISPCLAANQSINQSISRLSEQSLSGQSLPSQLEPIKVAGFGLGDVINTVRQGVDLVNEDQARRERRAAEEKAAQERQAQEAAMQRQQQEQDAARAAAVEQQQLEAQQQELEAQHRRQAFDNLSPAQKEAYMAQQRAEQEAMWTFFGTLLTGGGSSASPSQSDQSDSVRDSMEREEEYRRNNPPEPEPAPASVEPVDPFYGNGPGGSFYGH